MNINTHLNQHLATLPPIESWKWLLGPGSMEFLVFKMGYVPRTGERTCMTQGVFLGPQNDATFEGPMILRVNHNCWKKSKFPPIFHSFSGENE